MKRIILKIVDFLFGYDFFISYSHADGGNYPRELAALLKTSGYTAFLDTKVYVPGDELNAATKRRVRMSKYLVVLARPHAIDSVWVHKEVQHALAANRSVIVVDFNGGFEATSNSPLFEELEHHLRISEKMEADGTPSQQVIEDLCRSFKARRQETIRLRAITSTAVVLFLSTIFAVIFGGTSWYYKGQSDTRRENVIVERDNIKRELARSHLRAADARLQSGDIGAGSHAALLAYEQLCRLPSFQREPLLAPIRRLLTSSMDELGFSIPPDHYQYPGEFGTAALSPDGKSVAIARLYGTRPDMCDTSIWNVDSYDVLGIANRQSSRPIAVLSPKLYFANDSRHLLVHHEDCWASLYDKMSSRAPWLKGKTLPDHKGFELQYAAPSGTTLIASKGSLIRVWDLTDHSYHDFALEPSTTVFRASLNHLGTIASVVGDNRLLYTWEVASQTQKHSPLAIQQKIANLCLNDEGSRVALQSGKSAILVNLDCIEQGAKVLRHERTVTDVAFSSGTDFVATVTDDHVLRCWDATKAEMLVASTPRNDLVWDRFDPAGRFLISGLASSGTLIRDARSTRLVSAKYGCFGKTSSVAFSASTCRIAAVTSDQVRVHDANFPRVLSNQSAITDCKMSSDGRLIATATESGAIRVWKTATGKQHGQTLKHSTSIRRIAFGENGTLFAGTDDGKVLRWQFGSNQPPDTFSHHMGNNHYFGPTISLSKSGRFTLISTLGVSGRHARVLDLSQPSRILPLLTHPTEDVVCGALSGDGNLVALAGRDGIVSLHSLQSRTVPLQLRHPTMVRAIAFSQNDAEVVTVTYQRELRRWSAAGEQLGRTLKVPNSGLVISPDSTLAVSYYRPRTSRSSLRSAWIIDIATGRHLHELELKSLITALAFDADGKELVVATLDGHVHYWNPQRGKCTSKVKLPDQMAIFAISPNLKSGVVKTNRGLTLIDLQTHEVRGSELPIELHHVSEIRFTLDSSGVLIVADSGALELFDSSDGKWLRSLQDRCIPVTALAFDPYNKQCVFARGGADAVTPSFGGGLGFKLTSHRDVFTEKEGIREIVDIAFCSKAVVSVANSRSYGEVKITGLENRKKIRLDRIPGRVSCMTLIGETSRYAVASESTVRISDKPDQPLTFAQEVHAMAATKDGQKLAVGCNDGNVYLADLESRKIGPIAIYCKDSVSALAFDSSGRLLATGTMNGSVRIWDVSTGFACSVPYFHEDEVLSVRFNPTDDLLVTASRDGTGKIWKVPGECSLDVEWIRAWIEASTHLDAEQSPLGFDAWQERAETVRKP